MVDIDAERLTLAQHHVRRGREIVAEQRMLIERIRNTGRACDREEILLSTFEDSLAIFEKDLRSLLTGTATS